MATVIKRKRDPIGDTLGALGQGLSGYASGYMGRQQMDMAQQNSDLMRQMMERMFGKNGQGIDARMSPAVDTLGAGAMAAGPAVPAGPDISSILPFLQMGANFGAR